MVDSQFSSNACSSRANLGVEKSVDTWCVRDGAARQPFKSWCESHSREPQRACF